MHIAVAAVSVTGSSMVHTNISHIHTEDWNEKRYVSLWKLKNIVKKSKFLLFQSWQESGSTGQGKTLSIQKGQRLNYADTTLTSCPSQRHIITGPTIKISTWSEMGFLQRLVVWYLGQRWLWTGAMVHGAVWQHGSSTRRRWRIIIFSWHQQKTFPFCQLLAVPGSR